MNWGLVENFLVTRSQAGRRSDGAVDDANSTGCHWIRGQVKKRSPKESSYALELYGSSWYQMIMPVDYHKRASNRPDIGNETLTPHSLRHNWFKIYTVTFRRSLHMVPIKSLQIDQHSGTWWFIECFALSKSLFPISLATPHRSTFVAAFNRVFEPISFNWNNCGSLPQYFQLPMRAIFCFSLLRPPQRLHPSLPHL